jgi:protein involved in polysaccharide export with SLBB domain
MRLTRSRSLLALMLATGVAAAPLCADAWPGQRQTPAAAGFQDIGYAQWTDAEPEYRFYPGDQLDVSVLSAPELSRTVTVQPDGRISLSLINPVMVADRTVNEVQDTLTQAYSGELLRPDVTVSVRSATPLKVFVLGEVGVPGSFDMAGDLNALQAIAQAGGFKPSAKLRQVVIIRRGPGGRPMRRVVDLAGGLRDPANYDLVPLRRFDIVYVPRTSVAEAGLFVQQYLRDLQPVQMGFTYATGRAQIY